MPAGPAPHLPDTDSCHPSLPATTRAPRANPPHAIAPQALKREAVQWKTQYAENLHQQAKDELDRIMQWLQETNRQLKREINDLDDVRQVRGAPCLPPPAMC